MVDFTQWGSGGNDRESVFPNLKKGIKKDGEAIK